MSSGGGSGSRLWPLTTVDIPVEKPVDNFVDYSEVRCGRRTRRHCSTGAEEESAIGVPSAIQICFT